MPTTFRTVTSLSAAGLASIPAEQHSAAGTLSGDSDVISDTQDIGTSSELITFGEITAGGAAMVEIVNLGPDNFISISFETPAIAGTKTFKILAGESALLPRPSAALYGIANTAEVKILKRAVEA